MNKKHTTGGHGLCSNHTKATPRLIPQDFQACITIHYTTPDITFQAVKEAMLQRPLPTSSTPKGCQGRATDGW